MVSSISTLFSYNHSLVCAFFAWIFAQILKIIFVYITDKRFNLELLFSSGGMPSAHSAAVTSLAVAIGREFGINSPMFSIAAILAAIVMYDSSGVRRSSGEQAKILNKMVEILNIDEIKQADSNKKIKIFNKLKKLEHTNDAKILKEQLGHTVVEVFGGALLGILIVLIIPF